MAGFVPGVWEREVEVVVSGPLKPPETLKRDFSDAGIEESAVYGLVVPVKTESLHVIKITLIRYLSIIFRWFILVCGSTSEPPAVQ
jgi:hypothetical protein